MNESQISLARRGGSARGRGVKGESYGVQRGVNRMPRIRQYAEQYIQKDFWAEINRRCPVFGIQSDNNAALAKVAGVSGATMGTYKKGNLGTMQIKSLQKLISALKPDAGVVLRALGYSAKDIKDFARAEAAGNGAVGNGAEPLAAGRPFKSVSRQ